MAEALARKYGSDVVVPSSAGLSPAFNTHALTRAVLLEKNVELGNHLPRKLSDLRPSNYDLVVNMSGSRLPEEPGLNVETWDVDDPFGRSEATFREIRDQIEMLVMRLILRIRSGKFDAKAASSRQ